MKRFLLSVLLLFVLSGVWAQVSLTNGAPSYSQNFDAIGATLTLPTNWRMAASTATPTWAAAVGTVTQQASSGTPVAGGTYNWGSIATERAVGAMTSGGFASPNSPLCFFTNGGTSIITDLAISYDAERYRINTAAASIQFYYSLDGSTWISASAGDVAAASFPTGISAYQFSPPLTTINVTGINITALSIAPSSNFYLRWNINTTGANSQGIAIDNLSLTATFAPANTITTGTVLAPPFVLIDCLTPGAGTVDFTSTDVYTSGNAFTAQLSDDIGSFASPVFLGSIAGPSAEGTAPSGSIPIVIPAGTVSGTGYKIRVISSNPAVSGTSSAAFQIIQSGACASSHTDYYRSRQTGNWAILSTWESSQDNSIWINATLLPTINARNIYIRNGHTVTLTASETVDQVEIQNGGILENNMPVSNTLTVSDGSGDDIDIKSGGIYLVTSGQAYASHFSINFGAVVHIEGSGTIQIGNGGSVGGSNNNYAITSTSFVWDDASVFLWNTTTTPGVQVIFFPDAAAGVIPIFRFVTTPSFSMGGGTNTIVNGRLEATSAIAFTGTGTKTFRNGIVNSAAIDGISGTSGKFIINGTTAQFGGTGGLSTPATGLEIGSAGGTTVTMTSNKTVTGDISLISTNTYVDLGANNLTVTGTISNGGQNAFIKTNGTGVLTLSAVTSKTFPIGNTSYNPIVISSGAGVDYSARVETGISPVANSFPTYGINRTWDIQASAVNAGVIVAFQYATADANAGVLPQPQSMEILQYSGAAWSILVGNTGINPTGADPAWIISTATGLAIPNASPAPYALGKDGGWILPIDCIISTQAQKRNNTGIISWTVNTCAEVTSFEVQRSVNNGGFQTIGTIRPGVTETDFSFTDAALESGRNLYRIKVNRLSGAIKYSNTVTIIHNSNDILISSLTPNPVHNTAILTVSTGHSSVVEFKVYNMLGNLVKQWQSNITEGNNPIEMNVSGLPAGMYTLFASNKDAKTVSRFVKQ